MTASSNVCFVQRGLSLASQSNSSVVKKRAHTIKTEDKTCWGSVPEASHEIPERLVERGRGLETRGDTSPLATPSSLSDRDISTLISAYTQYVWDRAINNTSHSLNEARVIIFHIIAPPRFTVHFLLCLCSLFWDQRLRKKADSCYWNGINSLSICAFHYINANVVQWVEPENLQICLMRRLSHFKLASSLWREKDDSFDFWIEIKTNVALGFFIWASNKSPIKVQRTHCTLI